MANAVFTPTAEEVDAAKRVLQSMSDADGAATASGGMLIDEAVARQARRTVAIAERTSRGGRAA